MIPIHERIKKEIIKEIDLLKKEIAEFLTPYNEDDKKDHFYSRLHGKKSSETLGKNYDKLRLREQELYDINNYIYYHTRGRGHEKST